MADGIGHRDDAESEGQRYSYEANADLRNPAAITALPQPAKVSQNVPIASAAYFFACMNFFLPVGPKPR
jgi:hypothetical protein